MSIAIAPASASELCGLRPYLMRVALSRMRDREAAEDVVQEALAAACVNAGSFGQRSSLRTWVTGILLHKVTDAFRARMREPVEPAVDVARTAAEGRDLDEDARWTAPRTAWCDPETALDCSRFREAFEAQLARLPERQARAFAMREIEGLEPGDVCAALGVTEANLHVLLHRARTALRAGLDREWFRR